MASSKWYGGLESNYSLVSLPQKIREEMGESKDPLNKIEKIFITASDKEMVSNLTA